MRLPSTLLRLSRQIWIVDLSSRRARRTFVVRVMLSKEAGSRCEKIWFEVSTHTFEGM